MKTTILCALVAGGLLAACSDPERAEHRPVAGIDARHRDDINPFDEPPGQIDEPFLQSFNEKLVAEIQKAPGRAAVFPALSWSQRAAGNTVNGLGEHMAEITATALENAGLDVLARDHLVSAIHGANQWLRSYGSTADALALAEILGAEFIVTGQADLRTLDAETRDESLVIDWICYQVKSRAIVARYKESLAGGPLARELTPYSRLESRWQTLAAREREALPGTN